MTKQEIWEKYGWAISMAAWITIGVFLMVLYSFLPVISVAFLVAYGSFSLSGVLGFMFGIPGRNDSVKNPTNLELIADWLTKLLLGAGLIELKTIASKLDEFASILGPEFGATLGSYFVLLIIISFSILGLLSGYLWSQLHFKNAE